MAKRSMRTPTSVDLFACCGGLTRGLEWAGFDCIAFNELNSDAADSFAANFPNAIRLDGDIRTAITPAVIKNQLKPRIKEKGGLDLLCGGPPCQGFSGIGHRRTHKLEKKDIPTNHLFHEMINAIVKLQPKVFLFENVEGILSGRWTDDGERGEIFRDVWAAFSSIRGYVSQPTLIHAYGFGVPQNRPRVMIMGIQKKYCSKTKLVPTKFDPNDSTQSYASQLRNNGGFFPVWDEENIDAPDLVDVLSDLDFEGWSSESKEYSKDAQSKFQRFIRGQKPLTGVQKAAWELMQRHTFVTSNRLTGTQAAGRLLPLPKFSQGQTELTEHEFSKHSEHVIERFQFMLDKKITNKEDLPPEMRTKKIQPKTTPCTMAREAIDDSDITSG